MAASQLVHFRTGDCVSRAARFRRDMFGSAGNLDEGTIDIDEGFDCHQNCLIFGLVDEDTILAIMRIHVLTGVTRTSPAYSVFGDVLGPELDQGFFIVDSSGFCVRLDGVKDRLETACRLLSVSINIANRLSPSKVIATARDKHDGFYRYVFGADFACSARDYPGRRKPLALYMQQTDRLMKTLDGRGDRRFALTDPDVGVVDDAFNHISG